MTDWNTIIEGWEADLSNGKITLKDILVKLKVINNNKSDQLTTQFIQHLEKGTPLLISLNGKDEMLTEMVDETTDDGKALIKRLGNNKNNLKLYCATSFLLGEYTGIMHDDGNEYPEYEEPYNSVIFCNMAEFVYNCRKEMRI
jgi:hypothetical protein